MSPQVKKAIRYLIEIVILAIAVHLAARLGLKMAYVQVNTSPVWPPSGIALAALLLLGIRYWPGIALGVVAGSILTGAPPGLAIGLGLANTMEALIGAILLKQWIGFHLKMDRVRDVIGLAVAAAVSTAVSASLGVLTLAFYGNVPPASIFTIWVTWWIGNLLGILVVTPFILVWIKSFPDFRNRPFAIESLVLFTLLIIVSGYIFVTSNGSSVFHQAAIYMIFPFAIWAALRLEQFGAVTTVLVVSGISIWGTVHGRGPFAGLPINESLILLQTFTGVVGLTSLTLAAAASERRSAEQALNRRVEDLAALDDASKEFLSNLDKKTLYDAICRLAVQRLGVVSAWIELKDTGHTNFETTSSIAAYYPSQPPFSLSLGNDQSDPAYNRVFRDALIGGITSVHSLSSLEGYPALSLDLVDKGFLAAIPMRYSGKIIGALGVISVGEESFKNERVLLLESFANLAVVAVQNSWLFDQVRSGNDQLHALSHRLMKLQEQERMHLSRELHDESGQILAALMVRLGLLERDAKSHDWMSEHIAELKRIVTEVLNNLHSLAVKLRPASLDHLGLITALEQYIQEYSRQYGLQVQFDGLEIEAYRLPAEIETAFFRVVQESLTNVALHARASRVDILVNHRNGYLVMTIEDDGIGFDPNPIADENRLGLFGMRERIEMLGGRFQVESSPGKGTTIVVEVPHDD
jgi:signal transduction histidine kinase